MLDELISTKWLVIAIWNFLYLSLVVLSLLNIKTLQKSKGYESSDLAKLNKDKTLTPQYVLTIIFLTIVVSIAIYLAPDSGSLEGCLGVIFSVLVVNLIRQLKSIIVAKYIKTYQELYAKMDLSKQVILRLTTLETLGYFAIFFILWMLFPRMFFFGAFLGPLFLAIFYSWKSKKS